jgi:putative endonuclease
MNSRGTDAENQALAHLQRHGLRCLLRNYRARRGELDLVMEDGETIVIAEVRSRSQVGFGGPLESVDFRKQQRIIKATLQLMVERPRLANRPFRFDVIGFDSKGKLLWIRDAFQATD